jgi:hypothetical protein
MRQGEREDTTMSESVNELAARLRAAADAVNQQNWSGVSNELAAPLGELLGAAYATSDRLAKERANLAR